MKKEYYFKDGDFIIEDFDKQRAFTSFLPAVAGKKGIPIWAYYVNRGQGMSSFGIRDKNGAILENFPAYTAYEVINHIGFRTFIKINGVVNEIFCVQNKKAVRKMYIKREEFAIEEINSVLNIKVKITYYGLPNENFGALVRKIEVTNINNQPVEFEILDGLTQVFTVGIEHGTYKVMSNLLRSWMDVYNLENNTAFYKLRAAIGDSEEVGEISEGNFYMSLVDGKLIKPIVDPVVIFGNDRAYHLPLNFMNTNVDSLVNGNQYYQNKVPCGFTGVKYNLDSNKTLRIDTVIGRMHSLEAFMEVLPRLKDSKYLDVKQVQNIENIEVLMNDVNTTTSDTLFDEFIKNTYLDNMLRGGYPFSFNTTKGEDYIYYLYSRRHGDPERDYNFFSIANEYYSQGNGNFRDVCQNRRSDVMFNRNVKDYNLEYFMNLIQLDGYNPLSINGATFELNDKSLAKKLTETNFINKHDIMIKLLSGKFTPGSIVNTVENNKIDSRVSEQNYLAQILGASSINIEASFGEGYWSDHFTYLLDLLESYAAIYPDNLLDVLFNKKTYKYYDSTATVLSRDKKIVLTPKNTVRQFGAVNHHNEEKANNFEMDRWASNWAKNKDKQVIYTNLFSKIFTLAINKFALLDNHGIGIEMEAGKPGWNDAMNGLPGLFGSGVSETFETLRLVNTLINIIKQYRDDKALLPHEFINFYLKLVNLLKVKLTDYEYWDKASCAREEYRELLITGVSKNIAVTVSKLLPGLKMIEAKLKIAIDRAKELGNGIYPTYLVYEVEEHEPILINDKQATGYKGWPLVKPLKFKLKILPNFLEASARSLKVIKDKKELKALYSAILESDIYDPILKMYKTCGDLDSQTNEIGRIRAFTKGWLERESNFMHMSYKYLYGLLKAGLYTEFYKAAKTNLSCYMNPKVYGRSPLEASSFIAPTCNPDPNIHGQGFVARLTGTNAEMLSIYLYMMTGGRPFKVMNGELILDLQPKLTKDYFTEDGKVSFTLLGDIEITYITKKPFNTFLGVNPVKYELVGKNSLVVEKIAGDLARKVRAGEYRKINVYLD